MASPAVAFGLALAVAALAIAGLGWLDPKRVRERRGSPAVRVSRRLLAVVLALPGAWLVWLGHADAFVAWFGATGAFGWLAAQLVNRLPSDGNAA